MGWDNLEEELCEEFGSYVVPSDLAARREWLPDGYLIRNPKPKQDLRAEGRAKVNQCLECGGAIERQAHAKFCTTRCKNRYHQRAWLKAHPEWKPKSRAAPPSTRPCAHCGALMELGFRKTKQLYCNHNCAHKAYYARKKRERPEEIVEARRRFNQKKKLQKEQERQAA